MILNYDEMIDRVEDIFVKGTYELECFQPYSYNLRLAEDDCLVQGQYYKRGTSSGDDGGGINIPSGQLAFLSTMEEFNLHSDLLGRFGLKFRWVRKGLIPLFSPFVVPGSKGRLYFPLYNASAEPIYIRSGTEIITLFFHKVKEPSTCPPEKLNPPNYQIMPEGIIAEHKKIQMLSVKSIESQLEKLRQDVNYMRGGQEQVMTLAVSVIVATVLGAILQTMFGLFSLTGGGSLSTGESFMGVLTPILVYIISIVFVGLLIFWIFKRDEFHERRMRRYEDRLIRKSMRLNIKKESFDLKNTSRNVRQTQRKIEDDE